MSRRKHRKKRGKALEAQIRAAQMPPGRATAWNGGHIQRDWGSISWLVPLGLFYDLDPFGREWMSNPTGEQHHG